MTTYRYKQPTPEQAREFLRNLEAIERQRTGLDSLRSRFTYTLGYFLEISDMAAHVHGKLELPEEYEALPRVDGYHAMRYRFPYIKTCETAVGFLRFADQPAPSHSGEAMGHNGDYVPLEVPE